MRTKLLKTALALVFIGIALSMVVLAFHAYAETAPVQFRNDQYIPPMIQMPLTVVTQPCQK